MELPDAGTKLQSTADRARAAGLSGTPPDTDTVSVVRVEGYEVLDVLGRGGMGVVYKARQTKLDRVVALKTVLVPDGDSAHLRRFQQEAALLARLQHPNIVAVYDYGVCVYPCGQAFFAMELLAGEDLRHRIARTGPVTEYTAWTLARQAAAALDHAATHGIVHRDVKPANLFLVDVPTGISVPRHVGFVKVTDFGIALSQTHDELRPTAAADRPADVALTTTGSLLGTPLYMAPEQFFGSRVDIRADIYSLGCTVSFALAGVAPFDGRTAADVLQQKTTPPRLPWPASPESADLVAAMLAVDPNARPRDYAELIRRIDALPCMASEFGTPLPPPPRAVSAPHASDDTELLTARTSNDPTPPAPRPRRWWLIALTSALVAGTLISAVLGGLKVWWLSHSGEPSAPVAAPKSVESEDRSQLLFARGSIAGWAPLGDSPWKVVRYGKDEKPDPDRVGALTGTGTTVRRFDGPLPASFRVGLSLDFSEAEWVEVVVAADPAGDRQLLIVVDNTNKDKPQVAFGRRSGGGAFVPNEVGWRPIRSAAERRAAGKSPYAELKYTRVGDRIAVPFGGGDVVAAADLNGLQTTELRINATGTIFIDAAHLEDQTAKKK